MTASFTIGLIGCGTIGGFVGKKLAADPAYRLDYVFARDRDRAAAILPGVRVFTNADEVADMPVDLVVEAATAEVVMSLLPRILGHSDVLPFTLTPLADARLHAAVEDACRKSGRRLFVPNGAIIGLDGIAAAREALSAVTIRTTKSPRSLGLAGQESGVVYDGPTRGACARFTRNVNVHAALALAGLGFDRTRSVVVADPAATTMSHEIMAKGDGISWSICTESPAAGAVTSSFTPLSALAAVRRTAPRQPGIVLL